MNTQWVLFHLQEALDELSRTVRELDKDAELGEEELQVALTHVSHHLNTAWNSRAKTDAETAEASETDFHRWRAFPADIPLSR